MDSQNKKKTYKPDGFLTGDDIPQFVNGIKIKPLAKENISNDYEFWCNILYRRNQRSKKILKPKSIKFYPQGYKKGDKIPQHVNGVNVISKSYQNPSNDYQFWCNKLNERNKNKRNKIINFKPDNFMNGDEIPQYVDGKLVISRCFSQRHNEWQFWCYMKFQRESSKDMKEKSFVPEGYKRGDAIPMSVNGIQVISKQYKMPSNAYQFHCNRLFKRNCQKNNLKTSDYFIKNRNLPHKKEKITKNKTDRQRERRQTDPMKKFSDGLRHNIKQSFKRGGSKKSGKTFNILGMTFDDFRKYISDKWTQGMNWDNYGNSVYDYNGNILIKKWNLDHIIPVNSANSIQDLQLRKLKLIQLNHYSNFQPMWSQQNIKKGG